MDFDKIFEIMDETFPDSEMRSYDGQKKLLDNSKYNIYVKRNDEGSIVGFLAYWDLDSCLFFEHLVVSPHYRGRGLGSQIILDNIKNVSKPIFLEVELPTDEASQRRINFYKRFGFILNDFYYEQPDLRLNCEKMQLMIMSYPNSIDEAAFAPYKKEIYKNVYNQLTD